MASSSNPTPPLVSPSSDSTLSPGASSSDLTSPPQAPISDPTTPPPGGPNTTPTLPSRALNSDLTPPHQAPISDPITPPPGGSKTTPILQSGASSSEPTPPPQAPVSDPTTLPPGGSNTTPTLPSESSSSDPTPQPQAPISDPTTPSPGGSNTTPRLPSGASSSDPTPPPQAPLSDPITPPLGGPNTTPTLPSGASSSNPTPPPQAPVSDPTTLSPGGPNTTPALPSGASSSDPTPPPQAPVSDLTTPPPGGPNTTPTLPSGASSSDPTPLPQAPVSDPTTLPPRGSNTTPTLPSGSSSFDPTPQPQAPISDLTTPSPGGPNTTPTLPSGASSSDPTPPPQAPISNPITPPPRGPNTTPTLPSGASSSDPTPPPQAPISNPTTAPPGGPNTTPTLPSGASSSDPTPPPQAPVFYPTTPPPGGPNTTPTLPSGASSSDPTLPSQAPVSDPTTPPPGGPNTTPILPSGSSSSDPTPPPQASVSDPTTPPPGGPNTTPTLPSGASSSDPTPPHQAPVSDPTPPHQAPVSDPTTLPPGGPNTTPTPPPEASKTPPSPLLSPSITISEQYVHKVALQKLKIFLEAKNETTTITLHGETGVGKTWMAREICREISKDMHNAGKESLFSGTLWLSLNKKYHGTDPSTRSELILVDIARKLCVLPSTEGGFEDDDDDEDEHQESKKDLAHPLQVDVIKKLHQMMIEMDKSFVLILDGVPDDTKKIEAEIIHQFKSPKNLKVVMITSTKSDMIKEDPSKGEFLIGSLRKREFLELLKSTSAGTEGLEGVESLIERFKDVIFRDLRVVSLPAAVAVVVGKALRYNFSDRDDGQDDRYSRHKVFENALKEATKLKEAPEKIRTSIVRFAFDTLPSNEETMIKCCWHSKKFFKLINNASVHYNELISHWIMEGYFDHFKYSSSIVKAYEEGYRILKELMKRGLLKVEDEDFIAMEGEALEVQDYRREGFDETATLGLPDVFQGDEEWQGLGKIAVADGMIKTVCRHRRWWLISTLIMDQNRLCREVPNTFFKPMTELKVLVLLNPRLKSLDFIGGAEASPLSKLRLLVLRGCDVLEDVSSIGMLESLIVLEISGAKLLKEIPDALFNKMTQLRSLNLSGIQVKSLPIFKLTKLRWLILRECSKLEEMPSLKDFEDLEVLDMFGAYSLTKFKDKRFGNLKKLRVLDFSHSKIAPLPFLHNLTALTRLTLKGCTEITRLPHLKELSSHQVLELPGAKKFKEFYPLHLENKKALRILDLSETKPHQLPSTWSDLPSLEVLNLSHMSTLEDLGVGFNKLACLQCLNLSNTKVKSLPSLSNLTSLRQLYLSDCPKLEALSGVEGLTSLEILDLSRASELKEMSNQVLKLPKLRELLLPECKKLEKSPIFDDLPKLEVLNLSGCEALELENLSFQGMTLLEVLDLSKTKVRSLLSLSPSIRRLLLENCVELGKIPALDSQSKLEELSLCGVKSLQKPEDKSFYRIGRWKFLQTLNFSETSMILSTDLITKCTNLKKLLLGGCLFLNKKPQLKELTKLEVLDLSDTSVVEQDKSKGNLSNRSELINSRKVLSLEELSDDLKSLLMLTSLDLRGLEVKIFPYWISALIHLKKLHLPNLAGVPEIDWGRIKRLPDGLKLAECGIINNVSIHGVSSRPSISMSSIEVVKSLKQNSDIWEKCFQEFRIYVCPYVESGKDEDLYHLRDDKFEDIYFKTISCPESCQRFLEIRGFKSCPDGLEDALEGVDCLSFIEDDFITSFSDIGAEKKEAMTGLWLERCAKTDMIFSEDKVIKLGEDFNILWASNLPLLNILYRGNVQPGSFQNLTQLYLDCCPMLKYVFSSSQMPKKLEKLQVKFCDKLRTLIECESSAEEHELQNLSELNLMELPELTGVGAKLPGLKNAKVKGCPKLKKQEFIDGLGLQNKNVEVTHVEENWGRGAPKETKELFKK